MFNFTLVTIKLFKKSISNYCTPLLHSRNNQTFKIAATLILQHYYSKDVRKIRFPPENKNPNKPPQIKLNRPKFPTEWNTKTQVKSIKVNKNLEILKPEKPILETFKEIKDEAVEKVQLKKEVKTCVLINEDIKKEEAIDAKKEEAIVKFMIEDLNKFIDKDNKDKKFYRKKSWQKIFFIMFGVTLGLGGICAIVFLGKPKLDEKGNEIPDDHSKLPLVQQHLARTKGQLVYYWKFIREPSREKLLPNPAVAPFYQPPYTLVLEFTDVLVHPEWSYEHGWRFKLRPGLEYFLDTLDRKFEMVVYTAGTGMTVLPIVSLFDKKHRIRYKLVRDSTNFLGGHHVKDLDKLNRDLSKVIVVDWDPNTTKLHTTNLFKIPRWDGNDDDTVLIDLSTFLLTIWNWQIEDVRTVLENYSVHENPLKHFKERQKMLLSEDV